MGRVCQFLWYKASLHGDVCLIAGCEECRAEGTPPSVAVRKASVREPGQNTARGEKGVSLCPGAPAGDSHRSAKPGLSWGTCVATMKTGHGSPAESLTGSGCGRGGRGATRAGKDRQGVECGMDAEIPQGELR